MLRWIRLPSLYQPSLLFSCRYSSASQAIKNEAIKHFRIRLILQDGTNHGEISIKEARSKYDPSTQDLVLVNDKTPLPVCKIISKKEAYDKQKRIKAAQLGKPTPVHNETPLPSNAPQAPLFSRHASQLKEVEVKGSISHHDLAIKIKKAINLLTGCYKVQITISPASRKNVNNVTLSIDDIRNRIRHALVPEYAHPATISFAKHKIIMTFKPKTP